MISITRLFAVSAFALTILIIPVAQSDGAVPTDLAKNYMQSLGDKTLGILGNKAIPLSERELKVRKLLGENLAVKSIGKFVIGNAWRAAKPEQRADYQHLFSQFLTLTYAKRLGGYAGEQFTITGVKPIGKKNDILVTTTINRPSGPPLIAGWRIRPSNGAFKILDVMVEGISMVVAQRSEFTTIIKKVGMQGLIETLRAKVSSFGVRAP
ncbi:MAG: ABC transporter substrate-binding protein [Proteobacteria bacterium]|nr:ABC transporter substrate-binding protein [Pseudomonadota bacterium]